MTISLGPDKNHESVAAMFNDIAHRYDFLNHFLSLGVDKIWRKQLISNIISTKPLTVLDIATGTGDLAIQLAKSSPNFSITGIDISSGMLELSQQKLIKAGLTGRIRLVQADALHLPFPEAHFDSAMVAFGVRNFSDPVKGMTEIIRVLKPGGKLFILEFSMPSNSLLLSLYGLYFKYILPFIGRIISGHKLAYSYLPDSVTKFPNGKDFTTLMESAGFRNCNYTSLSFGIATLYEGKKDI